MPSTPNRRPRTPCPTLADGPQDMAGRSGRAGKAPRSETAQMNQQDKQRLAQHLALAASHAGVAEEVAALLTGGASAKNPVATTEPSVILDGAASVAPGVEGPPWPDGEKEPEFSGLTRASAAMEDADTELSSLRQMVRAKLSSPTQQRKRRS